MGTLRRNGASSGFPFSPQNEPTVGGMDQRPLPEDGEEAQGGLPGTWAAHDSVPTSPERSACVRFWGACWAHKSVLEFSPLSHKTKCKPLQIPGLQFIRLLGQRLEP